MLTCADASTYLEQITWTGWGAPQATGRATLVVNTCTASCAAGKYLSEPAQLALGDLRDRAGRWEYGYVWMRPDRPDHLRLHRFQGPLYY